MRRKDANTSSQNNGNSTASFQTYASEVMNRMKLAASLGSQYNGNRDIYEALGYTKNLKNDDYWLRYKRQDIAKAIIDRPVKATWRGSLAVLESNDDKDTQLEIGFKQLVNDLKLKNKFARLDKLTGLGRYGVLLLGLNDVSKQDDWKQPASKRVKINYVKPLSENSCEIKTWENKTNNPRYGLPKSYLITLQQATGSTSAFEVHCSRVIHVSDDNLDSEIYGTPRLEVVFNRLMDLEKLVGGSAEMFWREARPGMYTRTDKEYEMPDGWDEKMQEQVREFEHGLRRMFALEGADIKQFQATIADPANHVDVQIQMLSTVTGIPKRILVGSERGELASSQDQDQWLSYIQDRRQEFVEPCIIRSFVDWCIKHEVLQAPKDDYSIQWDELFSISTKDKVEIGKARATALKEYMSEPSAWTIMPPEAFMEHILALNPEQITLIQEQIEQHMIDEEERVLEEQEQEPIPQENEQE